MIIYTKENIPAYISTAIYSYGDSSIYDIVYYIDLSEDHTKGIIITPDKIYYHISRSRMIDLKDIQELKLHLTRHDVNNECLIQTSDNKFAFDDTYINSKQFIQLLADMLDINITYVIEDHEAIEYYSKMIIDDVLNDVYEDVVVDEHIQSMIDSIKEELAQIENEEGASYNYSLEKLLTPMLELIDELEIDSDEVDALFKIQDKLQKQQEDLYNQTKSYYDTMAKQYADGNTALFDQVKRMTKNFGLDEETLQSNTPEQNEQLLDNLCERLGISRAQIEKLAERFKGM